VMHQTMAAPIHELNQAIQTLARSVEELKRDHNSKPVDPEFESNVFEEVPTTEADRELSVDDSMLGLRWFANWRQGASMKGAV